MRFLQKYEQQKLPAEYDQLLWACSEKAQEQTDSVTHDDIESHINISDL